MTRYDRNKKYSRFWHTCLDVYLYLLVKMIIGKNKTSKTTIATPTAVSMMITIKSSGMLPAVGAGIVTTQRLYKGSIERISIQRYHRNILVTFNLHISRQFSSSCSPNHPVRQGIKCFFNLIFDQFSTLSFCILSTIMYKWYDLEICNLWK